MRFRLPLWLVPLLLFPALRARAQATVPIVLDTPGLR